MCIDLSQEKSSEFFNPRYEIMICYERNFFSESLKRLEYFCYKCYDFVNQKAEYLAEKHRELGIA